MGQRTLLSTTTTVQLYHKVLKELAFRQFFTVATRDNVATYQGFCDTLKYEKYTSTRTNEVYTQCLTAMCQWTIFGLATASNCRNKCGMCPAPSTCMGFCNTNYGF